MLILTPTLGGKNYIPPNPKLPLEKYPGLPGLFGLPCPSPEITMVHLRKVVSEIPTRFLGDVRLTGFSDDNRLDNLHKQLSCI